MTRDLRRYSTPAFLVGLGGLAAAGLWYFYRAEADWVLRITLALGLLGLAAGVLLDPERVRRAWRTRQARYGSNALLLSLSVAGILLLLNVAAARTTSRWDLTEDQQYSLSPETILVLADLPGPAEVKGFFTADLSSARDNLRPLLEEYGRRSGGKVTFSFVDPNAEPLAAQQYGITRDGTVVVILADRSEVVSVPDEQEITSALVRLAHPEEHKIYFLTGHGEMDLQSSEDAGLSRLRDALVAKNYTVESLNLLAEHDIPEGAQAVVIAGARQPLSADEIETLRTFSEHGGGLLVLSQSTAEMDLGDSEDRLATYLAEDWGITLQDDVVVDLRSAQALWVFAAEYPAHAITDRLQRVGTYYPIVRSLELADAQDSGRSLQPLVRTSDNAWGETDLQTMIDQGQAQKAEGVDFSGPLTLAAAAEDTTTHARLVVFGDADFATNFHYFNYANGDMAVNSIDWVSGQENLINLTPRETTQRMVIPPTALAQRLILVLTVFAIPGIVLVWGLRTAWERRRRA